MTTSALIAFGFVRRYRITHAAAHDGGQLGAVLDWDNTASEGVGRHSLPLGRQPGAPRAPWAAAAIPAQKAPRLVRVNPLVIELLPGNGIDFNDLPVHRVAGSRPRAPAGSRATG
jgi:hypothetical protein